MKHRLSVSRLDWKLTGEQAGFVSSWVSRERGESRAQDITISRTSVLCFTSQSIAFALPMIHLRSSGVREVSALTPSKHPSIGPHSRAQIAGGFGPAWKLKTES